MPNKPGLRRGTGSVKTADADMAAAVQDDAPVTKSMLREVLQETLKEILQPMLNDAIQPMMIHLEEKLSKKVDDIGKELRPAVATLKTSVAEQAEAMEGIGAAYESLQLTIAELERKYGDLQEKLTSFEDRSRRNNIRVVGIGLGEERSDPVGYIQSFLQQTFPEEFPESPPEVDRAHRTGPPRSEGEVAKPRAFLVRIHFFRVKERILQLSRQAGQLKFNGKKVYIFPDWSAETSKKRAAYGPVKEFLRSITVEGVKYGINYPSKFWVAVDGSTTTFNSPKEALAFCKDTFKAPD